MLIAQRCASVERIDIHYLRELEKRMSIQAH